MTDKARQATDRKLKTMEKKLTEIYSDARIELTSKWNKYMAVAESRLQGIQLAIDEARRAGADAKTIQDLEYEYRRILRNETLQNKQFQAMVDETTFNLANVNQIAVDYVNGNMASIYSINYNQISSDLKPIAGYSFTLVDEATVKNLATSNASLLPKKKLDIPKDQRWNKKKINSQVMQGILQGESIKKIATRLEHVTDMNRESAIRNARTMTTSAECKGRQDSYEKAQSDGIILQKEWMAFIDDRTRSSHAELDGTLVDVEEVFPNGLMYPADPSGLPEEVYNCRCTVRAKVIGFKRK